MDPLSITAGILALLDTTKKVVKYGLDFAGAPKEVRVLKENLETLESLLTRLMARCENAQKLQPDEEPPWLRGLWEVRRRRFDKDGAWVFEYKGMVAQLKELIEETAAKLNPSRDWKRTEAYQRATWHYRKETFTEMHTTVTRCCVAINTILALNNDEALKETLDLMKENNEYTKIQLASIDHRMSMFEANQKREEDKRKREEEESEREGIAEWLSPLSFIAKQDELWTSCFQETGEWLWRDQRFQVWTEGRPWFLQCVGAQGVGKTVLSSILTHHLPRTSQRPPPVLSIYLNYKSSSVQTLPHLVGSLLKQLIQLDESYLISDELRTVYKKAKRLKLEPISYFDDIHRILVTELDRYDRFFIVVDGFDELPARERVALQRELLKLRPEKGSLVITMRPISEQSGTGTYECNRCHEENLKMAFRCNICDKGNYDICYDCKQKGFWCMDKSHSLMEPYGQIEISVEIPHTDIENYVRWEIGVEIGDGKPVLKDDRDTAVLDNPITTPFQDLCQSAPNLSEQIVTEVTNKANGRFLFARLYMDSLKTKSNLRDLKRALKAFPDNTDDIYKEAMHRIQAQEPEERKRAYRVLGMVTCARRPFSLKELQHALAVGAFRDDDSDTEDDIADAIDQPKTILGSTSALVILEEKGTQVRLVHRSLEEYLHVHENSERWLPNADVEIAKACMIYLGLVLPRKPCQDEYYATKEKKFPFLQYASQYWGDHVRIACMDSHHAADIQAAALRLIDNPQRKDACLQAAWVTNPGGRDTWDVWRNVDKLHICAWFGLSSIFSEIKPDHGFVDVVEPKYGQTPLMYACRNGHTEVAHCLLLLGASQQKVSARGRTALFEAILGHHTNSGFRSLQRPSNRGRIVELLVCEMPGDLDINFVHGQEFNRTALMLAARLGHLEMIQIMLKHPSINVDLQDINGMTALYLAAREDHYEIVQLLLDAEASIDVVDFHAGRSPLRCAAERNHRDTVDLLLQYGADPALQDRERGTAMLRAVNRGAKEALEKMMEYPIDMMCVDEDGQSLLHGAARNGFHEITRLLIEDHLPDNRPPEVKSLVPDVRDRYGLTPLHDASQRGHAAVVSVLLEKGANSSLEDEFGRDPFMVAWQYGHNNIMGMLGNSGREHGQQSTNDFDKRRLPIWSMTRRGLVELVADAIKTRTQELHVPEPYIGNSPLHCAIEVNEPDILSMLLEIKMLPVNKPNRFDRTPLHIAALEGDLQATKLLIDHGANVDLKDRWKDEALVLAQSNQHLEIMLTLVEARAMIDKQKIDTKRLFFFAVELGKIVPTKILVEEYGVDRSIQNSDGVRAVQIATAADDEDMLRLLKSAPTVNFEDVGRKGPDLDGPGKTIGFRPFRSRPLQL